MARFRHRQRSVALGMACCLILGYVAAAAGQTAEREIMLIHLPVGRSHPIHTPAPITRVSIANPEVADVVVMGGRDLVINGLKLGETDVIIWEADTLLQHYRVAVRSPADQPQIVLSVKFAEVRRDFLRQLGASFLYRPSGDVRVGTDIFRTDEPIDPSTGTITVPPTVGFGTVLTNFGTEELLGFLDAEQQNGDARILAEPNLMAANNEPASFLAGGELPIPIAQATQSGVPTVTIDYREFGIRLNFTGEVVSDSIVRLQVRPEVSSLDFGNAITISGFRIPALRTRRIESTVNVRRDQSLVISGLFDDERERVRTGVPLLMDIPILGRLFSSTRWQRNQTELLVVVTPVVTDPMHPRPGDVMRFKPDTTLPARGALEKRLREDPPRQEKRGPPM